MMMNWLSSQSVWQIASNDLQQSRQRSEQQIQPLYPGHEQLRPAKRASKTRAEKQPKAAKQSLSQQNQRPKANQNLSPSALKTVTQDASQALNSLQKLEALLEPKRASMTAALQAKQPTKPSPRSKKPFSAPPTEEKQEPNARDSELFQHYLHIMDDPHMLEAIRQESYKRMVKMLEGLDHFQSFEWEHTPSPAREIWRSGSMRLLDYGGAEEAPAILCIPSLINKSYILDLYKGRSLVEYLMKQGFRPLLIDWGEPGSIEKRYDCADYIKHELVKAFRYVREHHRGPIITLGYCMGGVFALALAQLEAFYMDGLILLATPWDFQPDHAQYIALDDETIATYEQLILEQDVLPPVWIQTLFHMVNPWHFQQKFQRFPKMSEAEKKHFIAVESWVNDGVPLAKKVARECLVDWPHKNVLAEGKWRVGGWRIDPRRITCPTLIIAPTEDRIVPIETSLPLSQMIVNATCLTPKVGHVSMIVGKQAKRICWEPIVRWINALQHS